MIRQNISCSNVNKVRQKSIWKAFQEQEKLESSQKYCRGQYFLNVCLQMNEFNSQNKKRLRQSFATNPEKLWTNILANANATAFRFRSFCLVLRGTNKYFRKKQRENEVVTVCFQAFIQNKILSRSATKNLQTSEEFY